jgi:HK97 family phage major capsid protein
MSTSYKATIAAALARKHGLPIAGYDRHGRPLPMIAGGSTTAPETDPTSNLLPHTLEDLKGKTPEELRNIVEVLDAHLRDMHQTETGELRDMDGDTRKAFDLGCKVRETAIDMVEEHERISAIFRRRPKAVERVYANIRHGLDDTASDVRRLTNPEARDRALRILDSQASRELTAPQKDEVERQVRRDTDIARRLLVTENEHYREAWMRLVTDPNAGMTLTDDERQAVRAWQEYRAMGEVAPSAGGFGIPVLIDPSIILTAQETDNPFLQLARQVPVNTNLWKGVSSAGVTWAFQTEAAEVTDNAPTLAQPSVTVHMARGFIPYSIEVGQDYPSFANEMATLLAAGYDELLIDKFTRGSGTGEPQGLLTALSANTNVRVQIASALAGIGTGDPYKVWKALPQKYRRGAAWLMSVDVNNAIRQLGTSTQFHAFTANLREEWLDELFRKGVYESPYMPDTTTSTAATIGLAIVGNFQNYLIARRGGMSVELVPQLFALANNRPSGQRGWFAYARIGAGSVNDLGFRLLVQTG